MRRPEEKFVAFEKLYDLSRSLHSQRLRVVSTNGCFDILHLGHIQYLNEARALGDILVVAVNSDASVRTLNKGADRPIFDERTRALQIAGLECVDYVTIFDESTPEAFIRSLRPSIHVKGGDYDPAKLPEKAAVEQGGGKVLCVRLHPGFSTTSLIERIRKK